MKHDTYGIAQTTLIVLVVAIVIVASITYFVMKHSGEDEKPELIQTGSSTVLPLGIAWAEEYPDADISVSGGGSSHGLNALLNGEADLGDASRLMKGSDYEKVDGDPSLVNSDGTASAAAPTYVWPEKWIVAYDVLTVTINNDNDFATQLTYDQLYKIFTNDSPAIYWDEVPDLTGAPHEKIEIYAPDEASGTYDFFFEEIIGDWGKDTQVADTRLNGGDGVYHPSADDNVILNAIKDNEYAIGFFGYAYYKENPDLIQTVDISHEGTTFVEASLDNVAYYPMARPLYIYTDHIPEPGTPVNDYLRYIFTDGQELVPEIGYVKLELVDPALVTDQLARLE